MPEPLTPLEQRVYHYMIDFLADNTYQPSIREIAKKFRIKSTKTVSDLLHALSSKGYIERDQSRSRGVRILGLAAARLTQPVPVYDGAPFSEEQRNGYVTMDRRFLPTEDVVFARASVDVPDHGVLRGDHVLIAPRTEAKTGELVAVRDDGGVTVRTAGPDVPASSSLGLVAGIFRPLAEQAPAPMLPISDAQAAVPVS
jgi:repressor LexA